MHFEAKAIMPEEYGLLDQLAGPMTPVQQRSTWAHFMNDLLKTNHHMFFQMTTEQGVALYAVGYTHSLPFQKKWMYLSRGPVCTQVFFDVDLEQQQQILESFLNHIKATLDASYLWVRFDPEVLSLPLPSFVRPAHKSYHPKASLFVDLTCSEDEILAQMKQKGRYNIKVAQKHGVTIHAMQLTAKEPLWIEGSAISDALDQYDHLVAQTTARDGFSGRSKAYITSMLRRFGKDALLVLAQFEGRIVAGGVFVKSGDRAVYYYGASSNEDRKVMAPYLVQWFAMRYAKRTWGSICYDFLGISSSEGDNPELASVTSFKQKFGGEERISIGTYEMVLRPMLYHMVVFVKKIQQLLKGR